MPRSSSLYLFEQLTGEIIFSHLTASIYQCIMLPQSDHQSRHFFPDTNDTKLVFDCTKQLLMIDQHPSILFQELEADLFFRFSFNQTLCLTIPSSLKNDLFIIGGCEIPIYTEEEKLIDKILVDDLNLTGIIFPNQSPAIINDDGQCSNNEQSTFVNHRYCIFESTLKVENVLEKLMQLERLLAFFTARHLLRLVKCYRLFSTNTFPFDFHKLIESIRSYNFKTITEENISTLTSITLSCIGFAGFSMPINIQSDIIKYLNNSIISQENKDQCRFYFLNALFKTGRLLFYHVNDTQKGWRRAILTSMVLLSERISTIEVLQKSIQTDLNAVLDRTAGQMKSIDETRQSLNNMAKDIEKKMDINRQEINKKMDINRQEINKKMDSNREEINRKIDKMQESTNEELKKIIKLITLNEEKKSRSCSCILL